MINTRTRAFASPGKYYQGPGEINKLEKYTSSFGPSVLAVIGGTFFNELSKKLLEDFKSTNSSIDIVKFDAKNSEVSTNELDKIKKRLKSDQYDVVVGMGGGKVLDIAKVLAWKLDTNLIIFPTSVSSDAPTIAAAVIYTDNGSFDKYIFFDRNPDVILLDTDYICRAPVRLFVAGMGDALSTFLEVRACAESDAPNIIGDGYRRTLTGYAIAKCCYDKLFEQGLKAKLAFEQGLRNEAVEDIIEVNTLMSGLGSECNGTSGAHGFHDGLTNIEACKKCLHGELVSFGIMCALSLENREYCEISKTAKFLLDVGLPITLEDIGYTDVKENELRDVAKKMMGSLQMNNEPFLVDEDMIYNAILIGDTFGKHFKKKYSI